MADEHVSELQALIDVSRKHKSWQGFADFIVETYPNGWLEVLAAPFERGQLTESELIDLISDLGWRIEVTTMTLCC